MTLGPPKSRDQEGESREQEMGLPWNDFIVPKHKFYGSSVPLLIPADDKSGPNHLEIEILWTKSLRWDGITLFW